MRNEIDTFGLLEVGDLDEPEGKREGEETFDDDWDY
jgi:hypothetical protein